jgi:RNA polymerase sigma-70 factor, ECF subfamily
MPRSSDAPRAFHLDPLVERALRDRLWARDERALAELIATTPRWLVGVAAAVLGDRDAAEEVVMDVYRTAWERVTPSSDESMSLMPWLLRITRNRAIDRLRARRRRPDSTHHGASQGLADFQELSADEPVDVGDHVVHDRVQAALAQLSSAQRAVVALAFFEGLSHSEIAERTGTPLGTVKTRVRTAMQQLRTLLGDLRGLS